MSEFQSIEDKLSQLIPSAVSERGLERMDEAIDQLFLTDGGGWDTESETPSGKVSKYGWHKIGSWKSAAILVLLIVPAVILNLNTGAEDLNEKVFLVNNANPIISENPTGMLILNSTQRIHSSEDDGVFIPDDGSAPEQRRSLVFIDEDQMRDEKTGIIVTVRGSSRGIVSIPVTEF